MIPDTLPSKKLRKRYRDNERVNERFERNFNGSMRRRQKKRRGGREDDSFRFDLNRLNGMKPQQLTREIKFLSKKKRYNELRALSRSSSIPHNVYTYTALITSFALSTLVDKRRIVDDMFIEMEEKEILPNSYTITAALVAVDGGKEAMEFLDFAREKYGHCIELSELVIYNAAIKCCSRSPRRSHLNSIPMFSTSTNTNKRNPNFKENYEYALHLYANMINDGIQPNHLTFGYLLHVLGISKQAELAIELWEEMKSKVTYFINTYVDACLFSDFSTDFNRFKCGSGCKMLWGCVKSMCGTWDNIYGDNHIRKHSTKHEKQPPPQLISGLFGTSISC